MRKGPKQYWSEREFNSYYPFPLKTGFSVIPTPVTKWSCNRHVAIRTCCTGKYKMYHIELEVFMKPAINMVFGITAYTVLSITVAYTAGFVANVVPGSIDASPQIPLRPALLLDICLLGLFVVQQRWVSSGGISRNGLAHNAAERYSAILITSFCLLGIVLLWQPINALIWDVQGPVLSQVLNFAALPGWLLVVANYHKQANVYCRVGLILALGATATMTAGHLLFFAGINVSAWWVFKRDGNRGLTIYKAGRIRT